MYEPALLHPVHRFGSRIVDFRRQAALMAIINRTPDSFYDWTDLRTRSGRRCVNGRAGQGRGLD
jgi:hypothetical protein